MDVLQFRGTVRVISYRQARIEALQAEAERLKAQIDAEEFRAKQVLARAGMPTLIVLTHYGVGLTDRRSQVLRELANAIDACPEMIATDETWTG